MQKTLIVWTWVLLITVSTLGAFAAPTVPRILMGSELYETSGIKHPTTVFKSDTAVIYCGFDLLGSKKGDKITGTWVAVDVGAVAPPNTTIDSATIVSPGSVMNGNFSLSKPTHGWPLGRYRLAMSVAGQPIKSIDFVIQK